MCYNKFMVAKNDLIELHIDALGSGGEGVATLPDGMKIFVPRALPGERALVKVLAVKKRFAYGKVERLLEKSPDRVEPPCTVFGKCGGCALQHLDFSAQLAHKTAVVADALRRIGHLECAVNPCLAPSEPYGYRNKVQLPIGVARDGTLAIGFYREGSHDIVNVDACPLHGEWVSDLISAVRAYARRAGVTGYSEATHSGTLRHVVARKLDGGVLVCIVTRSRALPKAEILREELERVCPDLTLVHNVNAARTNVILGEETRVVSGKGYVETEWHGVRARVVAQSFLQVNTPTALAMYAHAARLVGATDVVVDAYAGAGIMSAIFARHADEVYGVEICKEASLDADFVKAQNGITNLTNLNGDCAEIVPTLLARIRKDDPKKRITVVLDPPRKGCDEVVLNAVLTAAPDRIVYISCDPATLARDLAILCTPTGYTVTEVTPYAMFPQTKHVETIVCLRKQ